jgi:type IV pilus assembly protein PilV
MRTQKHGYNGQQRGFTLLEVLIALLVLSIGLLGLAALQTTGLRSNQMASMRTLVSQFAYDISDRMRANQGCSPVSATCPAVFGVLGDEYVIGRTETPAVAIPAMAGIAYDDLLAWRNNIARLPNGQSAITQCNAATVPPCPVVDGKTTHVVTVYWNESRSATTTTFNCPPLSDDDFRCFQLVTR